MTTIHTPLSICAQLSDTIRMMTTTTYQRNGIGERVARYRKWRGFKSPRELADAIPGGMVTKATIVNIELGRKADPSVGDLVGIAYGLGISPLALLFDIERPMEPTDLPELIPGEWASLPALSVIRIFALAEVLTPSTDPETIHDPAYIYNLLTVIKGYDERLAEAQKRGVAEAEAVRSGLAMFIRTLGVSGVQVTEGDLRDLAKDQRAADYGNHQDE